MNKLVSGLAFGLASTVSAQLVAPAPRPEPVNIRSVCGATYATLSDAWIDAPAAKGDGCAAYYITPPVGWERVPVDDPMWRFVVAAHPFGVEAVVLADDNAYNHDGDLVEKDVMSTNVPKGSLMVKSCAPISKGVLLRKGHDTMRAKATDYVLPLKTLIISNQADLAALPIQVYQAHGAPFELLELIDPLTNTLKPYKLALEDEAGNPKYNAIVLTTQDMWYTDPVKGWTQALKGSDFVTLRQYVSKYAARMVVMGSSWNADGALTKIGFNGTAEAGLLSWINNEEALRVRDTVPLTAKYDLEKGIHFWYPTTVHPRATHVRQFMTIRSNNTDYLGAFTRSCMGREEMHFMFTCNDKVSLCYALADVWFQWANKGVFLGQRRVLLDTQVDDFLLRTGLYNTSLNRQAAEGEDYGPEWSYRANATDLKSLVDFQNSINARLPRGSKFVIELAYNGKGWYEFESMEDNTNPITEEFRDNFTWVSHTWNHIDLYCLESNCAANGPTKYGQAFAECKMNIDFANTLLFKRKKVNGQWVDMTDVERANWPTFSPNSIVTPRISGLNHSESIQAMYDAGHRTAVGDSSRKDLQPDNIFHTFLTRVAGTKGALLHVIPRFPTRIYFDVSTPEQSAMEHATFYGPDCYGKDLDVVIAFPYKCNRTSIKYDRNLTIAEMLQIEAKEVTRNMFHKRTDPYMFHQANLRFFWHNGEKHCLMCMWIETIVKRFMEWSNLPIISLKMDDLRRYYDERAARDACGISGSIQYKGGRPTQLNIKTAGTCKVKLTRTNSNALAINTAGRRRAAEVEMYGDDETFEIASNGAAIVLPVTPLPVTQYAAVPTSTTSVNSKPTITSEVKATGTQYPSDFATPITSGSGSSTGAIVGGVVGAIAAVALIVGGALIYRKKKAATDKAKARKGPVAA